MSAPNAKVYEPRTRVAVRLNLDIHREISTLTGIPLLQVQKHGDKILKQSMADTIAYIEGNINKYVPKATGQLRNSFVHQLHHSTVGRLGLKMNLGTFVHYMGYVAKMSERTLRHPRGSSYIPYKRNTTVRGQLHKKGSPRRNPGAWRWVKYYGGPRWVQLEDRKAQKNFFSQLVTHIKKRLEIEIGKNINATFPTGERRAWTDKFKKRVEYT